MGWQLVDLGDNEIFPFFSCRVIASVYVYACEGTFLTDSKVLA